jgi:hypothetical protein
MATVPARIPQKWEPVLRREYAPPDKERGDHLAPSGR